jgi:hypothetical protein
LEIPYTLPLFDNIINGMADGIVIWEAIYYCIDTFARRRRFFPVAQKPNSSLGRLIVEVSRSVVFNLG